jgi:hypothetical protein
MEPIFDMTNMISRTRRKEYTYKAALGFTVPVTLP